MSNAFRKTQLVEAKLQSVKACEEEPESEDNFRKKFVERSFWSFLQNILQKC